MNLETLCVHSGHAPDPTTGAIAPPIHLSTTFERDVDGEFRRGFKYARDLNPTRQALETALAAIEGGAAALAFASGQAATGAVFQALRPGDHVVLPDSVYYGTPRLVQEIFGPWGLQYDFADMRDTDAVARALRSETRIVWVETPSNPLLSITDIARVSRLAHDAGARVVVDNTWATPVGQQPLSLGADLAMHASTKYLGGHSDVMGGALIARADDEFFARIRLIQQAAGAIAGPLDSWLVLRGIRTLPWRVRGQSANAQAVATFLLGHPRVETVHYPGLGSHPGSDVVAHQMRLPGGMLSAQIRGGADEAMGMVAKLRLFTRATSLGGTESLIEHRASIEGPASRTPQNLVRMSIGLEHADDLIADLEHALG